MFYVVMLRENWPALEAGCINYFARVREHDGHRWTIYYYLSDTLKDIPEGASVILTTEDLDVALGKMYEVYDSNTVYDYKEYYLAEALKFTYRSKFYGATSRMNDIYEKSKSCSRR